MELSIRPIESLSEYHACEALQRRVWAMPDALEVVPLHLLVTVHRNGGLLLGAFAGGDLVGFAFSFPGISPQGQPKHCSHMMGVLPELQNAGIGFRLKCAQREAVLAQGIDLVTWTYDPLESRNAHLNIQRLGAVCQAYLRDYYGPLTDGLNAGLPTDRLQVEWWLDEGRVERRVAGETDELWPANLPQVNASRRTRGGLLAPGALDLETKASLLQIEIPAEYQAIKTLNPDLALEWRLATRTLFETFFGAGYRLVGFRSTKEAGARQSFYVLQAS